MVVDNKVVVEYFNKINDVRLLVEKLQNEKYIEIWQNILNNMQMILEKAGPFLNDCLKDNFRYADYFSYELSMENLISYFEQNYTNEDMNIRKNEFVLHSFCRYLSEMFELCDYSDFEELCNLLDVNNYYEKLTYFSSYLLNNLEYNKENIDIEEQTLPFLINNKYKIFFTGFCLEDVKKLDSNTTMQFIHKLANPLATETLVSRAEAIDHVKDAYGIPIQRVRFAADYRIAFMRVGDVTAILGVLLKTGKNSDYTRYDTVARKSNEVYKEIEKFRNGEFSSTAQHYQVMEILQDVYKKKNIDETISSKNL